MSNEEKNKNECEEAALQDQNLDTTSKSVSESKESDPPLSEADSTQNTKHGSESESAPGGHGESTTDSAGRCQEGGPTDGEIGGQDEAPTDGETIGQDESTTDVVVGQDEAATDVVAQDEGATEDETCGRNETAIDGETGGQEKAANDSAVIDQDEVVADDTSEGQDETAADSTGGGQDEAAAAESTDGSPDKAIDSLAGGQDETAAVGDQNEATTDGAADDLDESKLEDIENDDDVPPDFFDDFLNQDFMAGLDIVDDDEWENNNIAGITKRTARESVEEGEIVGKKRKRKKSKKELLSENCESVSPAKKATNLGKQQQSRHRESNLKPSSALDESDSRRDPEKTKRDIQRDKAKCAKDKEKKLLTERLSVVETGLVPPGMELDLNLDEVRKTKRDAEKGKSRSRSRNRGRRSVERRERGKQLKTHSRSIERKRKPLSKSPQRKIIKAEGQTPKTSPLRRTSSLRKTSPLRNSSPLRKTSPLRRSPLRPRILYRKSPTRRSSPRRSPVRGSPSARSPGRGSPSHRSSARGSSPRQRLSSYYRKTERDRYSPLRLSRRDRSYSPKRLRRRSRSRSPRRRRHAEDKKSFLQELAEKLNETRPVAQHVPIQPQIHYSQLAPHPAPVPAPTPAQFYQQQQQMQSQFDQYDAQFFIGSPQPIVVGVPNFVGQAGSMQVGGPQSDLTQSLPQPLPIDPHPIQISIKKTLPAVNSPVVQGKCGKPKGSDPKAELAKLLEDKKISLSDYLSISAKPEVHSSNPVELQEKIKVISRCQDAIKFLSNEKVFSGRLTVRSEHHIPGDKSQSPLFSTLKINFPFTTPSEQLDAKDAFTLGVNKLLKYVGVETVSEVETKPKPIPMELEAPPAPKITIDLEKPKLLRKPASRSNNSIIGTKFLMKMVQTDQSGCEACEKRNKISYSQASVQCDGPQTYSVGTQVSEEDINFIKKKQSLASLTPAQLLGKMRNDDHISPSKYKTRSTIDVDEFDVVPCRIGFDRPSFSRAETYMARSTFSPPSPPLRFSPPPHVEEVKQALLPQLFSSFNPNPQTPPFAGRPRDSSFRGSGNSRYGYRY